LRLFAIAAILKPKAAATIRTACLKAMSISPIRSFREVASGSILI
jgi:hypothetical protein